MSRLSNLTLKVDQQVLLWARMRALKEGTSLNRRVNAFLQEYAAVPDRWWEQIGEEPWPGRLAEPASSERGD